MNGDSINSEETFFSKLFILLEGTVGNGSRDFMFLYVFSLILQLQAEKREMHRDRL
jgi:hypothetical protein